METIAGKDLTFWSGRMGIERPRVISLRYVSGGDEECCDGLLTWTGVE